jgi:hypothetical protein
MAAQPPPPALTGGELLTLVLDRDFGFFVSMNAVLVWLIVGAVVLYFIARVTGFGFGGWRRFEIDEAQFGLGEQKITLRPNDTDRQIAYKVWVELSTRKIGLPIDLDDDVISEVYESWYNFFSVTRELIKDVPVSKFRRRDTEKIIRLSIEVLNSGIRPHLTKWQARFRRWYERALDAEARLDLAPQDVQKDFPAYESLKDDLMRVTNNLYNTGKKCTSW